MAGWALAGNPAVQAIGDLAPQAKRATREQIAEMNPRWAPEDLDAEAAALAVFDLEAVVGIGDVDYIPEQPVVPSLVQVADASWLVSPELADELRPRLRSTSRPEYRALRQP